VLLSKLQERRGGNQQVQLIPAKPRGEDPRVVVITRGGVVIGEDRVTLGKTTEGLGIRRFAERAQLFDPRRERHTFEEARKEFGGKQASSSKAQPGAGDIDHPISFASRKLSTVERNYTTTKREGLAMVYALQKFRYYLLGGHFKMFTDYSALKYLVNKPVLGGRICRWLLLFQEYDFEIVVNPGRMNKGPNHLSRLEHGEEPTSLEDTFLDA
jgi:hypothetical protein